MSPTDLHTRLVGYFFIISTLEENWISLLCIEHALFEILQETSAAHAFLTHEIDST